MTQTNRNQDTRKALEARVAALEAELAACQQVRSQLSGNTPSKPATSETSQVSAPSVTAQADVSTWQPVVLSLVRHTLLPTAVFDSEMRYVAASEGWLEAYGLQDHDIIGVSHYELFPEIGDDWKAIHARCLAGAHESRSEDAFPRADGGMDWLSWSVYPWYDSHEDIAGIVMSTAVVTDQVLARENERIFRQLVDSVSDGIVMSDLDDTIRYANPAYKAMLELDNDLELSGQSLKTYASSNLADLNATMLREGHWRGVIEQRRPSGDTFPAEVTAFAMRDETGALTRRAAIYRDISNQRRMLTELTHSSQQLQVIVQSLPVVLFVTDTEGIITLSEGQALPLLGLRPGEVVGRSIFEYYAAKQDVVDNVKRALAGQPTTFDMYFADQDLYFQRHFAPLCGEDGQVTGMLGIGYDITDRKRAEAELAASERTYRSILEAFPNGSVLMFDDDLRYTLVEGDEWQRLGVDKHSLVGKTIFELFDDTLIGQLEPTYRRVLAGERVDTDLDFAGNIYNARYVPLADEQDHVTAGLVITQRITERKRMEADLDAWKRRYDLIVASSGQVVYEYDIATGDITWSGSIKRVLGFELEDMAGGIDRWLALIHPADAEKAVAALERAQNTASAYDIEYRFTNAQGRFVPMVDRGFFITDENGVVTTMLGMMQDISDRKRAEKDLQLFRTLVASSTDGILLTNGDGSIAYANEAYGDLLGLKQADYDDDLLGELAEHALSEAGKATLVEAVGDILTTGRWEGFIEHQHKQGRPIPTLMSSFAINDEETGELQYVANIIKDITAQQDAQDRLVESERRLQILVANLPVILFAADKDGIVTLSEGQALEDIGLQAGEIVGLSIFEYYQDMPVIVEHASRALAGEATTFEVYYDKTDEYFERYFAPLKDSNGNVTGMLGIGYNITERKRANEALEAERKRVLGLYQAVPDTIIRIRRDGTFLDYKPSSYFASYVDPATTIGQNMRDNVAPEVVAQAFASLEAAIDMGEMQKFENVLTVDGETRYRENRFVKLNDDEAIAIVRDVTDLRRAEREITASQQRLQAVVANLPVVVFTLDKDGIFTMSEGKGLADIGLQPGQVVGVSVFDLYADLPDTLAMIQQVLAGQTLTFESQLLDQIFENHYTPLYDDAGGVSGVLGVAYNVTERKRAAAELAASERTYHSILEAFPNGVVMMFDKDLRYTLVEGDDWQRLGIDKRDLVGKTIFELFDKAFVDKAEPLYRRVLAGERLEADLDFANDMYDTRFVPIRDEHEHVSAGLVITRRITQRKHAENALRESQQQLERAQRVANFGNFAINVADMSITASAHALNMHELPQDAPLGLSDLVPLMSAADFQKVKTAIEQSVAEAREASVEYTLQLSNGIRRDIHAIWQTSQNERGEVYQIFGTVQDITRQKRAELALLENQRLLEDAQRIGAMGSWALEVATGAITWSKQTYALLEIDEDQPLSLELVMSSYVEPDAVQSAFERAINHAEPYDIEAEVITGGGKHRWVRVMCNPVVQDEHVVRLTGIIQDISDIKRAEAELQTANSHLARINHIGSRLQAEESLAGMLGAVLEPLDAPANAMIFYAHNDSDDPHTMTAIELAACYHDAMIPLGTTFQLADYPWTQMYLDNPHETFIVNNVYKDARINELAHPVFAEFNFTTLIIVPLVQGGRWTGIFQVGWSQERQLSAGERAYFNALPTLLAPAITNRRLLDNLEQTIAERTRALQDQLTETARFKSIVEATADLVSYGDLDGNILYLNPAGKHMLGYDERDGRYLPNVSDVYDDEGNERFALEVMPAVFETGVWRGETQVIGADGEMVPVSQVVNVIPDEQGHVVGIGTVVRDISESKRIERALRESEKQLELFFSQSLTGFFFMMLDSPVAWHDSSDKNPLIDYALDNMRVTKVNQAFADQYDRQAEDMVGFNVRDFFAHDIAQGSQLIRAVFEMGHLQEETQEQRADGTDVYVNGDYVCLYNDEGAVIGLVGVQQDVTAKKRAEQQLQASIRQLRRLSELSQAFNQVTSKQALLEVAAMLAFDEGGTAATLFDLDGQEYTGGTPETMTVAARSRADGKVDDIPIGLTFTLAEFASAELWLDYPEQLLCVENISEDDRIDDETRRVLVETANTQAYVVVPLLQNNRWVGTFNFTWNEPHTFLDRELQLYEALMTQVPPVLANLNIVSDLEDLVAARSAELRTSNEQLALINQISNELKAASSTDMMLEVLLEPLERTASASLFYAVTDEQNNMMAIELVARRSPVNEPPLGTVIQLQEFPSTHLWLDNPDSALIIADTTQDTRIDEASRAFYQQLNISASVMVPLRQSGEWVGMLFITYPQIMTFGRNDEIYFNALPAMLAPPLANRRMVENLEETVAQRSEELSRSRQLLRSTIDNAPLIIFVKDTDLRYVLANRNIHRVIPGTTPRDVIGRRDKDLLPEEIAKDVHAKDLDILTNKQVLSYESERNFEGKPQTFLVTKFPMLDENGELFALGTVATDISERKAADAKMRDYRDQLAKAETELRITQRIQELLLPASDELRAIDELDIASYMQPAEQVGGDYYDILHIGDRVKIGIGDVTGHGLESGLLMLMIQTAVRTLLSSDEHDSKRVMDILNRTVFANLQRMQVDKSLTLSLLDYNQGKLSLSGQHEHVLVMRAGGSVETIDTIDLGMPLGLEEDITRFIAEHVVHLQPGEGVVLFTDGITEAENDTREQFGLPRLVDLVGKHWEKPAEAIVFEIINAVYDHIAAHEVYDDITLVVFKRPLVTDAPNSQKALVK